MAYSENYASIFKGYSDIDEYSSTLAGEQLGGRGQAFPALFSFFENKKNALILEKSI